MQKEARYSVETLKFYGQRPLWINGVNQINCKLNFEALQVTIQEIWDPMLVSGLVFHVTPCLNPHAPETFWIALYI